MWALQIQPHRQGFSYQRAQFVLYRACQGLGIPCDVVSPSTDLSRYKLVFAPALHLATEQLAGTLRDYASAGAHLVFGVRSGFKTESDLVTDQPLPGLFRELVAADVACWHALPPGRSYDLVFYEEKRRAGVWAEALASWPGTETLATWTNGPFAGQAALTTVQVGEGSAGHWDWHPDLEQAIAVISALAARAGIARVAHPLPDGAMRAAR